MIDLSDGWTIYLEFDPKRFRSKTRSLCKRQFWLNPIKEPVAAHIEIVFPDKSSCDDASLVDWHTKVFYSCEGLLWVRGSMKEAVIIKSVISERRPTPRVLVRFWRI